MTTPAVALFAVIFVSVSKYVYFIFLSFCALVFLLELLKEQSIKWKQAMLVLQSLLGFCKTLCASFL